MTVNLFIFNQFDPSGKFSKEKYLFKYHINEYNAIINYSKNNNLDIPFKEKVYCFLNNLKYKPKCNNISCDNYVNFKNSTLGYNKYCSNKCQSTSNIVRLKKEKTNLKKYGKKYPIHNLKIKEKFNNTINKTKIEKNIINEKRKSTNLKRYGVDNVSKDKNVIEKRVESFKKNINNYREKYKETCLNKYNVDHPWKQPDIHYKSIKQSYKIFNKILKNTFSNLIIYNINRLKYKETVLHCKCDLNKKHIFRINYRLLNKRYRNSNIICTICNDRTICNDPKENSISSFHKEVIEYVRSIYSGEIIINDRTVIKPLEIDIYLLDLNIGIECNGIVGSNIKIGLYYNNELISILCLNKNSKNEYELVRFCNKIFMNIDNSIIILFDFFIKKYNPSKIISYSSLEWDDKIYEELFFVYKYITESKYYYIVKNIRTQYIYDENMYDKIWCCGSKKWIWRKIKK